MLYVRNCSTLVLLKESNPDGEYFVQINDKEYQLLLAASQRCNQPDGLQISLLINILLGYLYLYEGDLDNSLKHINSLNQVISDADLYLKG